MANEKRLIDANALKKHMCFKCNDEYSDEPCEPSDCVFCNAIADAPTVDAVEVVRCKDCKHYEIHRPKVLENCERNGCLIPMSPNDFCSYGERREGE